MRQGHMGHNALLALHDLQPAQLYYSPSWIVSTNVHVREVCYAKEKGYLTSAAPISMPTGNLMVCTGMGPDAGLTNSRPQWNAPLANE